MAGADLASLRDVSREGAPACAVIGTQLAEPVLVSLRRMAREDPARRGLAGAQPLA